MNRAFENPTAMLVTLIGLSVKGKAPLSCLSKEQLVATVKNTRVHLKESKLKCVQLEKRVQRMENEIKHHGIRNEIGEDRKK